MLRYQSHGQGKFKRSNLRKIGQNVIIEPGVLIFHPENVELGSNVYIGHNTILDGYHDGRLIIDDRVWIGPQCYFHAAADIIIESDIGFGPGCKILTSAHNLGRDDLGPIINLPLEMKPVTIKSGSDIGIGAIILPGITIAQGTQVGAGAVVTKDTSRYAIVAGIPAKKIGTRISAFEEQKILIKKPISQLLKDFISHIVRYCFDLIFFILLPWSVIYSWLRFGVKKIFHLKPKFIFSPFCSPLPLFAVKAIRTQGYQADNISYDCPKLFRSISFGLILADNWFLRYISYLTDYVFLFLWALLKYDFFELPFSGGVLANSHLRKLELLILKISAKKISVYGYGSDCKILSDIRKQGFKYNNAMDRAEETETYSEEIIRQNLKRAQKYSHVLIAGGDLIHFGKKGIMLPLAFDLKLWPYSPLSSHKNLLVIHSTNHRSHKGSRFIIEIFEKLKNKLPIKLLLIEKKTSQECQKLYPQGDIFITDVITGWHGFTAIEAMAIGRPVISYLRPDIMAFHSYYAKAKIPIISANPDNLAEAITKLVKNPKLREKLGQRSRQYALKFHSLEFVGALRAILYEYLWQNKKINQQIFEKEVKKRKLI